MLIYGKAQGRCSWWTQDPPARTQTPSIPRPSLQNLRSSPSSSGMGMQVEKAHVPSVTVLTSYWSEPVTWPQPTARAAGKCSSCLRSHFLVKREQKWWIVGGGCHGIFLFHFRGEESGVLRGLASYSMSSSRLRTNPGRLSFPVGLAGEECWPHCAACSQSVQDGHPQAHSWPLVVIV